MVPSERLNVSTPVEISKLELASLVSQLEVLVQTNWLPFQTSMSLVVAMLKESIVELEIELAAIVELVTLFKLAKSPKPKLVVAVVPLVRLNVNTPVEISKLELASLVSQSEVAVHARPLAVDEAIKALPFCHSLALSVELEIKFKAAKSPKPKLVVALVPSEKLNVNTPVDVAKLVLAIFVSQPEVLVQTNLLPSHTRISLVVAVFNASIVELEIAPLAIIEPGTELRVARVPSPKFDRAAEASVKSLKLLVATALAVLPALVTVPET